ncbi:MAG: type II toxin-antitoxin system RelE/ParE family toxin [Hyphomicrobiales bacterium]|nr:type II toxin-antitoxin system RelE/ParE family toxin [Hyphomicrobiales bacterium]
MRRVLLTAAAQADIEEALDWYKERAPAVVPRFREALQVAVARIAENSKQFPILSHQTRRVLLRRFPYIVIFRETRDRAYIVAVFHASRDIRKFH